MGTVLDAFRVPRPERAYLIDDPLVVPRKHWIQTRRVAEAFRLVYTFFLQKIDVFQQKLTALCEFNRAHRATGRQIGSLRQNPGVAQHTPTDQHALNAQLHPIENLLWFDAVAAAENRD